MPEPTVGARLPRVPRLTSQSATCSSDDQSRAAAKPAVFSGFVTARRSRGNGVGVAAWRGMQLSAHTRPATDRKQRGAALGTVALPTGATVGQSYLACVGNRDLCSADASTLRSRIGRGWRRVGHVEQHIRRGLKDHLPCLRSGRLIAVERSCADAARTPFAWRSSRASAAAVTSCAGPAPRARSRASPRSLAQLIAG